MNGLDDLHNALYQAIRVTKYRDIVTSGRELDILSQDDLGSTLASVMFKLCCPQISELAFLHLSQPEVWHASLPLPAFCDRAQQDFLVQAGASLPCFLG